MSGRKMLSIILVCSMLVSQPAAEAFGAESAGDARVEVETGMTAEESSAETETPSFVEGETENCRAEEAAEEESLAEMEREGETEAASDGGGVEVMTETALTEEMTTIEDSAPETEEEDVLTKDAVKAAEEVLSGSCGTNLIWSLEDGTLTISGMGAMEDYSGVYYNSMASWYDSRDKISKVIVYNGVTSIGKYAFQDCSLTSITIPDSVTSIGYSAFAGCRSLTGVYISSIESWCNIEFKCSDRNYSTSTCNPLSNGGNLYVNGSLVRDLIIPDSVTSIGNGAFSGCCSLTSVTIPSSVTSIGEYAFRSCSLTSITIPSSVTSIGYSAFEGCHSLISVTIPDSVTSIGNFAFHECYSLARITISGSMTSIGQDVFSYCSSLISITIPGSVTRIGTYAFRGCGSLTNITIPDTVTIIDAAAFDGCSSLTDVYYGGSEDDWNAIIFFNNADDALLSANIHYNTQMGASDNLRWSLAINGVLSINGMDKMADYSAPDSPAPWSDQRDKIKQVIVGQFVASIGSSAFADCANLINITIPMAVQSIGASAFSGCESLAEVDYIGSVTQWGLIAKGTDNAPLYKAKIRCRNLGSDSDKTNIFIQQKKVSYYDTIHGVSQTLDIDWGWSLMTSFGYNNKAAIAGLVLSGAAESSQENAEQAMKDLGFTSKLPKSKFYDKK